MPSMSMWAGNSKVAPEITERYWLYRSRRGLPHECNTYAEKMLFIRYSVSMKPGSVYRHILIARFNDVHDDIERDRLVKHS